MTHSQLEHGRAEGGLATLPNDARRASAVPHPKSFFRAWLTKPLEVGAWAPSSPHLARKMVEGLDLSGARAVVEFGPGTGVFTDEILPRLGEGCRYFAVERNPEMASHFRRRHPRVTVFEDSAENVQTLCARSGIEPGSVDYVLSGLPWPSFSPELRSKILHATESVLRPGGQFITFGYHVGLLMTGGWDFRRTVKRLFSDVSVSNLVWRNLPPAFVYRCVK